MNNGAFTALGGYGQFIFVNPTEQVVVAIQSAWRQLLDSNAVVETVALLRAGTGAATGPNLVGREPEAVPHRSSGMPGCLRNFPQAPRISSIWAF